MKVEQASNSVDTTAWCLCYVGDPPRTHSDYSAAQLPLTAPQVTNNHISRHYSPLLYYAAATGLSGMLLDTSYSEGSA